VWYTQFTGNEVLHRTERSSRLHFDRSRNAQQLREALTDHLELTAASGLRSVLSLTGTTDTATKGSARNLDRLVENARLSAVHLGASLPAGDRVSATNGELHGFKKLHVADVSALPSLPGVNPQASVMAFAKMYATEMFGEVSVS
jgi:choline dehydrogenase-like flavoprotein